MTLNDLLPFRKATGISHCGKFFENTSLVLNLTQNASTQTFLKWEKSKTKVILPYESRVLFKTLCNRSHFKYNFKYIPELEKSEESNGDGQNYRVTSLNRLLVN